MVICAASMLTAGLPLMAQDAQVSEGLAIAKERKARDQGWVDYQGKLTMVLRNAEGDESRRKLTTKVLEVHGDGDKSLNIFEHPRDVKGTALLSISHIQTSDEQFLYLPALKRVKRISSSNKSGPFMGSEFAYEDLSSYEVEKYNYRYLGKAPCGQLECFKLESKPNDKFSGYSRRVSLIDTAHYRVQQTDFYDRRNSLLKTLTMHDYKQYLDKFWRADMMKMVNHKTGKSTELHISDIKFKSGLDDGDFNKATLKRSR